MGILIKGMDEIPEDGAVLVVKHDNGKAYIKHACTYGYSMELVKLPAVQPERKKGNWVAVGECYVKCSECGLETTKNELRGIALFGKNEPYFCPSCGADMRGMEDG